FLFEASSAQVLAKFSEVISVAPGKVFAANDPFHCRRYEISNRPASGNSLSDFRRRNVDLSTNNRVDVARLLARAIQNNKSNQLFQVVKATPVCKVADVVFA